MTPDQPGIISFRNTIISDNSAISNSVLTCNHTIRQDRNITDSFNHSRACHPLITIAININYHRLFFSPTKGNSKSF